MSRKEISSTACWRQLEARVVKARYYDAVTLDNLQLRRRLLDVETNL